MHPQSLEEDLISSLALKMMREIGYIVGIRLEITLSIIFQISLLLPIPCFRELATFFPLPPFVQSLLKLKSFKQSNS